jgi:hypothetical protein
MHNTKQQRQRISCHTRMCSTLHFNKPCGDGNINTPTKLFQFREAQSSGCQLNLKLVLATTPKRSSVIQLTTHNVHHCRQSKTYQVLNVLTKIKDGSAATFNSSRPALKTLNLIRARNPLRNKKNKPVNTVTALTLSATVRIEGDKSSKLADVTSPP